MDISMRIDGLGGYKHLEGETKYNLTLEGKLFQRGG
jgi:hypothetical protein